MSTLIATAVSVGRLNDQSEIIAMRAGGLNFLDMFKPFLMIGAVLVSILFLHAQIVLPFCFTKMSSVISNIYNHNPIAVIDTGRFLLLDKNNEIEKSIFIESKDTNNKLINIQLRTKKIEGDLKYVTEIIIASSGIILEKIKENGDTDKILRLFNGYVFTTDIENKEFRKIDFKNGVFDILLSKVEQTKISTQQNKIQGLKSNELLKKYNEIKVNKDRFIEANSYLTEYHKRIALPLSTLIFMFIGFPLAMTNKRSGKGFGLGSSIIIIFIYFGLYLATDPISTSWKLPAWIAAWCANFICLLIGIYLYKNRFN